MISLRLILACVLLVCSGAWPLSGWAQFKGLALADPPRELSKKAADFLKVVDAGRYEEAVRQVKWPKSLKHEELVQAMNDRRKPLGAVQSRRLMCGMTASHKSAKRNVNYFYLDFATSFAAAPDPREEHVKFESLDGGPWTIANYAVAPVPMSKLRSTQEPNCLRLARQK